MGISRTIQFHAGSIPAWSVISAHLCANGEPPTLRMIDNLPAFPDEVPPENWRELRLSTLAGMVTIRRAGTDSLQCVVWGNADSALLVSLDKIVSACAVAGNGTIRTDVS